MNKWTYTTLGKISEIITGPFGSQLHQSDYVEQGIPVVMPQDIDNRKVNYASINYVPVGYCYSRVCSNLWE